MQQVFFRLAKYIVLDLLVEDADRAIWRFEMRDKVRPSVLLGHALQLNLIELRKADRLGIGTGALADWIALFEHWREEHTMSQIAYESVRAARAKLEALSADAETRRLAFVRERALSDERTLLREAHEDGLAEGEAKGRAEGKAEALGETAVNLIRNTSLDDPTIAAVTGLPVETVANLRRRSTLTARPGQDVRATQPQPPARAGGAYPAVETLSRGRARRFRHRVRRR